jgi:hypothetical protein
MPFGCLIVEAKPTSVALYILAHAYGPRIYINTKLHDINANLHRFQGLSQTALQEGIKHVANEHLHA